MGLDQYAKVMKKEDEMYWRKHNRLQGFMEEEWRNRGHDGEFNCVDLYVDEELLDKLEDAIDNKSMPHTEGFFFGDDSYENYEEYYKEDDLKFIKMARKALKDGKSVVYSSWW